MVNESDSSLKLHLFDVGHGDSLLLEFPDGKSYGIVDCHQHRKSHRGFGDDYEQSEPKALTYFRYLVEKGISPTVEFACLTHAHLDHYKGYGTLLKGLVELGIKVNEFWDFGVAARKARAIQRLPDIEPLKEQKDEMVSLLQAKDELIKQGMDCKILVNPTKAFWSKCGVEIDVLAPHANQFNTYANYLTLNTAKERKEFRNSLTNRGCLTDQTQQCRCFFDDNVVSSALLVKYGSCRLLLAGDITNCSWRGVLKRSEILKPTCNCIKISHHGSVQGNFPDCESNLWKAIGMKETRFVAVISGGYWPDLPHKKTLSSLKTAKCETYCTGSGVGITLRPYEPSFFQKELVPIELKKTCFVVHHEQSAESSGDFPGGHGNVVVECFNNGDYLVSTEFSYSRDVQRG